jgi:hypothetical protein
MKTIKHFSLIASLIVSLALVGGCGKNDETKPATDTGKKADSTASDVQKSVTSVADQAKNAVQKSTTEVQTQVQGIIDQAKSLVAEKKYTEAMSLLQQKLAGLKLTPEQQKLVDALKEQLQKAIASSTGKDAAKGIDDVKKTLGK